MANTMFLRGITTALSVFIFDQVSKWYILDMFKDSEQPIAVTSFFNLVMVWNRGVSFGMMNNIANAQLILSAGAAVIVVCLLVWLRKVENLYLAMSIGLIIGGAIGNIVDRVRFGAVADFLDFYLGGYHWPAFNVADSAICIGALLLVIDSFRSTDKNQVVTGNSH